MDERASLMDRVVLIHYHLFKNAGTSVDEALKRAFPDGWAAYERSERIGPSELAAFILGHPALKAVSSHNAWFPPPRAPGLDVIPVVFLRHPLDRVRSVYDFERSQGAEGPGARIAHTTDIRGYVRWRLSHMGGADRTIRDFQTMRLAPAGEGTDELECAMDATGRLPFVGLVEAFGRSLRSLQAILEPSMGVRRLKEAHANATRHRRGTLSVRLRRLEDDLGDEAYQELMAANAADLALWRHVHARYAD
jgi:hypothetical protein